MITFYGASDDLVEVEGCEGADEFNTYERGPVMWSADLIAPGGTEAIRVRAVYDECWGFAVSQVGDGIPLPSWPMRFSQHPDTDYSVLLEIDAPAGTRLTDVWPTREDES